MKEKKLDLSVSSYNYGWELEHIISKVPETPKLDKALWCVAIFSVIVMPAVMIVFF